MAARTALWFHKMFPFAELRTANWILSRYGYAELRAVKLFGYDLTLEPRTSVHVLLYLERERFVEDAIFIGSVHPGRYDRLRYRSEHWISHFAAVP